MFSVASVKKVWDRGEHNAFTDLCYFNGFFWLVFREGQAHISDDGRIVILRSRDGESWQWVTELAMANRDLRDPKIVVTPQQELLITAASVHGKAKALVFQSYIYRSRDGLNWSAAKAVGREGDWLWRTRFIDGEGYAVSYSLEQESSTLYKMNADDSYSPYVDPLFSKAQNALGLPNEHDLFSLPNGELCCLLRRDADSASAQLGRSKPPYKNWRWRDLGVHTGGPVALVLSNQTIILAVRLLKPERTSICTLDVEAGKVEELLSLPSQGDSSYAGLVEHEGKLWCSYYSSHEGKTSIYMAELLLAA
ncbi:hypothetical protein NO559_10605 [Dasania sp. GY-MA-18]|uniref:Exo-alpha-sialidase n=1 Tax=Dasania phycosphaerae TaxID=2950436 RepID=A0A9J6RMS9_9GAMM|nr:MULTISPECIES: hypothetical protein [Dasania]MCR8923226.1 hypothetical protein [Dasania sp. GY-MA-18]MCZ0865658.1 hypothetical protein [Dasania phycosphaerae]MCZ0869383.1 hypothetical protein [Dasania phycosphaerae]